MTFKKRFLLLLMSFLSVLSPAATQTANLIPGDTDCEIEFQSVTQGLFSNSTKTIPRWKHSLSDGYQSSSSILITREGTGMGVKTVRLKPGKYTFSFYAKSKTPGNAGYIAVTTPGHSWPRVLKMRADSRFNLTEKWQRHSVVFESRGQEWHSGYYGSSLKGAYFDRFMINAGTEPLPWISSSPADLIVRLPQNSGNVFPLGEKLNLQILLSCNTDERPDGKINYSIHDFLNKEVQTGSVQPVFGDDGQFSSTITVNTASSGWFKILVSQEKSHLQYSTSFVLARSPEPRIQGIDPFVGLCGAQEQLQAAKLIGVKWLQKYVSWYELEPVRGKMDFETMHLLQEFKKQGFKIQALVTSGPPPWAIPPEQYKIMTPLGVNYARCVAGKDLQESNYRNVMKKFMKRYKGIIDVYELGGELDALLGLNVYYKSRDNKNMTGPFVLGESFDLVCNMMKIAAEEILKQQPDAKISSVRPSDVDARYHYAYSREVFKRLGKYMNCFGIDCYPQPRWIGPGQPETGSEQQLAERMRDSRNAMKDLVRGTDVMISEYGYFIDITRMHDPKYASEQVNRLARSYLKARLLGMKSLFYFTTTGGGLEGQRYYMGLWHEGRPLAALASLNNVGRIVENVTECREIWHDKNIGIGVFRKYDNRAVAALWSIDSQYTPEIEFTDDDFEICDVMGNPMKKTIRNGRIVLKLNPLPCYIWRTSRRKSLLSVFRNEYTQDNYQKLGNALDQLKIIAESPLQITFRMDSRTRLKAYLANSSLKQVSIGYVTDGTTGQKLADFKVLPSTSDMIFLPLPPPAVTQNFIFNFKEDYQPLKKSWTTPELIRIPRISPADLPAALAATTALPAIKISGRSHIHPVDHTTYDGPEDLSAELFLAHDGEFFHMTARVTDDRHFNHFSKQQLWKGDCMQLGFDPEMNFIRQVNDLDPDDSTLTCGLQKNGAALTVYRSPRQYELQKQTEYAVTRNPEKKLTVYQVKIPLKLLGENLKKDSIFGFNCIFMDDDTDSGADYWLFLRQGLAGGLRPDKFAPCILE